MKRENLYLPPVFIFNDERLYQLKIRISITNIKSLHVYYVLITFSFLACKRAKMTSKIMFWNKNAILPLDDTTRKQKCV